MTSPETEEPSAPQPQPERSPRRLRWFLPVVGTLLLPLSLAAQYLAAARPDWIEEHYSQDLFPRIASALAGFSARVPMSLIELLILILIVRIAVAVTRTLKLLALPAGTGPRRGAVLLNSGLRVLALAGFIYTAYLASWGLNHHREPFATVAGWEVEPPATPLLVELACRVTEDLNTLRAQMEEDDRGVVVIEESPRALGRIASKAYANLKALHPSLRKAPGVPRRPLASPLLTASWITGIYSPFTAEAHVNDEIPSMQLGFVTCHELAHSLGFAREDEANFLAYMACKNSKEPTLRYSGALAVWGYLVRALSIAHPTRLIGITERLGPAVVRDLKSMQAFWVRERTEFTALATEINHNYLKSQGQTEGVATYGLALDLIAEDWRRSRPNYRVDPLASALEGVSNRDVNIAFIGGCAVYGGGGAYLSLPDRVGELLVTSGVKSRIYNLGSCNQSMASSTGALEAAIDLGADIVVLRFGASDQGAGMRIELMKEGFERLLFTARRAGIRVLTLTSERPGHAGHVKSAAAMDQMIQRQSEIRGARFVSDFTKGLPERLGAFRSDMEHPNYAAVLTMADRILPDLLPVIANVHRTWALEVVEAELENSK